jgi:transcription antitermination factor NusA-like protein
VYNIDRKQSNGGGSSMSDTSDIKKIMTKPLPEILADIEDSIRLADEAAKNAREAALEARKAGEKAANDATKFANERIDIVEQIAKSAMQLAEQLKLAVVSGVTAVNTGLSEPTSETENAPKGK